MDSLRCYCLLSLVRAVVVVGVQKSPRIPLVPVAILFPPLPFALLPKLLALALLLLELEF